MPRPTRDEQFDPDEICIVHAVQRCVRRAFLAGVDHATGKDYSFRKEWIRRRLESLPPVNSPENALTTVTHPVDGIFLIPFLISPG